MYKTVGNPGLSFTGNYLFLSPQPSFNLSSLTLLRINLLIVPWTLFIHSWNLQHRDIFLNHETGGAFSTWQTTRIFTHTSCNPTTLTWLSWGSCHSITLCSVHTTLLLTLCAQPCRRALCTPPYSSPSVLSLAEEVLRSQWLQLSIHGVFKEHMVIAF